jgi:hypothetical protein
MIAIVHWRMSIYVTNIDVRYGRFVVPLALMWGGGFPWDLVDAGSATMDNTGLIGPSGSLLLLLVQLLVHHSCYLAFTCIPPAPNNPGLALLTTLEVDCKKAPLFRSPAKEPTLESECGCCPRG